MTDKTSQQPVDSARTAARQAAAGPAAAAEGPYEVTPGVYKRLTTGLGGYSIAMLSCLLIVGLIALITPREHKETLPTADYGNHLFALRNKAPYTPYAPQGLPFTWRTTSSRVSGLDGEGPVAWHLGMVTPSEEYAALEQSDERPVGEYLWRMTNSREPVGVQQVAGQTWQRYYRKDKDQRSLVRTLPGLTLVVTGTASYEELAVLAAALKPQPKNGASASPSAPAASTSPSATPADRP
ncbi:DUF4245 domain-containing protein [Thermomonospora echinospora]|uniref:DUF4245 domain-containing protein n=1 Tax=Thermomonospora echinospora TaxID=1992 RepID=UPI001F466665|nr:DUF4245 domain-containing protein [Thermomonospora echinospora]